MPEKPLTILVVEDDADSLALLEAHLRCSDFQIRTAASGLGACAILSAEPVHIVLADRVMPGMDGVELCRWVRESRLSQPVHFVMLTAHTDDTQLVEAFAAGVDDFLPKPIRRVELLARLRAWARFVRLQSDLEAQRAALAALATQDELTKLANRREAVRRVNEQMALAGRLGKPLACALIDVDRFKSINDTYGHAIGDAVLREVAGALSASVRDVDGVFRLAGDEFLILLVEQTVSEAALVLDRARLAVGNRRVQCGEHSVATSISAGLAQFDTSMRTHEDLLAAADSALYAAKRNGRNAVVAA